jgi:methyl-accepting chemotaxis protein
MLNPTQWSIRARFIALFGSLFAAMIAASLLTALAESKSRARLAYVMEENSARLHALGQLRAEIGNARRFEKDILISLGDEKAMGMYQKRWQESVARAEASLVELGNEGHVKEQTIDDLRTPMASYVKGMKDVLGRVEIGTITDHWAANKEIDKFKDGVRKADVLAGQLIDEAGQRAKGELEVAKAAAKRMTLIISSVSAVVMLLIGYGAWSFGRRVLGALDQAASAARRVADGDLTQDVRVRGRDEAAVMLQALADMQQSLRRVVGQVRTGVDSVSTASGQIAAGNQDLSNRTEQQAGSLQQTASAMEQLTATVRQSADNARQANQLASAASEAAGKGGQVVGQVVATMNDITASSKKIADIISVIDGIAFQTNILALNAAVEAARAGDRAAASRWWLAKFATWHSAARRQRARSRA